MKRVRCPNAIISSHSMKPSMKQVKASSSFAQTATNSLESAWVYPNFAKPARKRSIDENANENGVGSIVVIENVFAYKQVIPLKMGDNVIGRYMKNSGINCPIETVDPSVDMNHCVINVSRDKKGRLKYVLRDGPSYTGTFVDNEILGDTVSDVSSKTVPLHHRSNEYHSQNG